MVAPLLSAADMAVLVAVDESAMPSTCFVLSGLEGGTITGGTSAASATPKHSKPLPCRVAAGGSATRERVYGERVQSTDNLTIQISLAALDREGVDVDSDDQIVVTTKLVTSRKSITVVETYKVVGDPSRQSYSTSLTVSVTKVS